MDSKKALKLFVVLSRAYRSVIDAAQKDIKRYGLSASEFGVVELLYHKGRQPIQIIGQKILLTSGSMTYVINQLETKGFAKRVLCEQDKRITYVELMDAGRSLMDEVFPVHEASIAKLFDSLTDQDASELTLKLKQLGLSVADTQNKSRREDLRGGVKC